MLRWAIRSARLHLPAPIGHNNGGAGGSSSDYEDACASPSVAYTSLRDDGGRYRHRPEDVSGVHFVIAERSANARKKGHVADLSSDEQRRAADAWARLQTLYGLFRELDAASDTESSDCESFEADEKQSKQPQETRRRRRRDDGLRSLLHEAQLPSGVILRDLHTLSMTDENDDNAMPHGFTAGMFAALGNAIYNEMMVAAEQNRISPESFEKLGNCLYADAASVTVLATA